MTNGCIFRCHLAIYYTLLHNKYINFKYKETMESKASESTIPGIQYLCEWTKQQQISIQF